jgi:hypothetical protein
MWLTRTIVGTNDNGFKMRSNLTDVRQMPSLYIMPRTRVILSARKVRALESRPRESRTKPNKSNSAFGTRHRGQGHRPLSRRVAKSILGQQVDIEWVCGTQKQLTFLDNQLSR